MYSSPFHSTDITALRFLVTGGAGFIGSHIAEYLLKHRAGKVLVVDDLSTGREVNMDGFSSDPAFEFVKADVNDFDVMLELCEISDYVIHQAAIGSVPRSIDQPLLSHHSNATGFLSVLEACRRSSVRRLVYASSSSVYGDSAELPKREENTGRPKSPYAVTKVLDELYAGVYSRLHGLEVIGLRYFNIFGSRQYPRGPYAAAIPLFILAAIRGKSPTIFGDGDQSRDFTFVSNAVQANVLALFASEEACGEVYNVACGHAYSLNQVIGELENLTGHALKSVHKAEREGDIKHSMADIGKASKILNYHPDIQLKEGLKQTFEWYRDVYLKESSSSIGQ